jgi:CRP-like cAMP-binding protein
VTPLTRIEMVVYLQGVDLFTHCSAEQMVRIAKIARQRRFAPEERIYSIGDPPEALYCVVEGGVVLRGPGGEDRSVGKGETFGVQEILSDRLRHADAWAEGSTTAALIDAEEFFDLLSNNIEIVKALFRQLLRYPQATEALHDTKPPQETATQETPLA